MPTALPTGPRARRTVAAMAAAGVLAIALVGCTGTPAPSPSPEPSSGAAEPIFASDEEALAAAEAAYDRYRAISAEIGADGGVDAERIDPAASPEYASTLKQEFEAFADLGIKSVGSPAIDSTSLAEWSADGEAAEVSIYLCRDVSGVRIIGSDGTDVTPLDREERIPTIAFFVSSEADPKSLVVDGVEKWSGENFC